MSTELIAGSTRSPLIKPRLRDPDFESCEHLGLPGVNVLNDPVRMVDEEVLETPEKATHATPADIKGDPCPLFI